MSYGPIDLIGNIGVVVLMIAYLMLQLNKLRSDGLAYSLLNAIGASFDHHFTPLRLQFIRVVNGSFLGASSAL
jgi:hypothetical protein